MNDNNYYYKYLKYKIKYLKMKKLIGYGKGKKKPNIEELPKKNPIIKKTSKIDSCLINDTEEEESLFSLELISNNMLGSNICK